MTMTAVFESSNVGMRARSGASRIARVKIFSSMDEAEAVWRDLEQSQPFGTAYQRYDFLAPWQRHVGAREGLTPLIAVAYDADNRPVTLLPLAVGRESGIRSARFLGGKHATFNMALWRTDFATACTAGDLDTIIAAIRDHGERVDVLALTRQPRRWLDSPNPMAQLPGQPSINNCPLMTIPPNAPPASLISNSFRRRLKGKERKLQALPGYRYGFASTPDDIKRLLDAFFVIKPLRMAAQKLPNVFADPGIKNFIHDACMTPVADGGHAIDIHALSCDDEVIAIFAGVADGHRFSMMFNTYTTSENSRFSPGLILMREIVDYYAGRNYTSLDLGIGSDDYKLLFCKDDEPIFDSFIPLTMRGKLAATAMSSLSYAKRFVKQTPALMRMASTVRGVVHR